MAFPPLADPSNRANRSRAYPRTGFLLVIRCDRWCSHHDPSGQRPDPFVRSGAAPTCEATHQRQTRASDAECPHGRIAQKGQKSRLGRSLRITRQDGNEEAHHAAVRELLNTPYRRKEAPTENRRSGQSGSDSRNQPATSSLPGLQPEQSATGSVSPDVAHFLF